MPLIAACVRAARQEAIAQTGAPERAFPLATAPGRRWLSRADGAPFLINGDAAWSLIANLSREDAVAYLDDRKAKRFNAVLVSLIEHKFAFNAPANAYGEQPFTTPGDVSTPNDAYFAHADFVIERAAERDMLVLLTPAYLGYGGGDQGWHEVLRANSQAKLSAYGVYVGRRYARFDNIMWVEGGDYDPPDRAVVRAIAEAIRAADPGALHTAHCAPESAPRRVYAGESWLDVDNVYTYGDVAAACAAQYAASARPFFLIESAYENEHGSTPQSLRRQAYQALLSGACGAVYGIAPVWSFDAAPEFGGPPGWRAALNSPGARSMQVMYEVVSALPWTTLVPDRRGRLLRHDRAGGAGRALAALAPDGTLGVVYLERARPLRLDAAALAGGTVTARWINPENGAEHRLEPAREEGALILAPPSEAGAPDALVVIAAG